MCVYIGIRIRYATYVFEKAYARKMREMRRMRYVKTERMIDEGEIQRKKRVEKAEPMAMQTDDERQEGVSIVHSSHYYY